MDPIIHGVSCDTLRYASVPQSAMEWMSVPSAYRDEGEHEVLLQTSEETPVGLNAVYGDNALKKSAVYDSF